MHIPTRLHILTLIKYLVDHTKIVINFLNVKLFLATGFQAKGPFNNYVDKMRGGGGQKMSVLVNALCNKKLLRFVFDRSLKNPIRF